MTRLMRRFDVWRSQAKIAYMKKAQVYLPAAELATLRKAATRSGRSVSALIRDAIRQHLAKQPISGPVALWHGKPRRTSIEHDAMPDEP